MARVRLEPFRHTRASWGGDGASARHERSTPSGTGEPGVQPGWAPPHVHAAAAATRLAPGSLACDARPVSPPETSPCPPHPESRPRASGPFFLLPGTEVGFSSQGAGRGAVKDKGRKGLPGPERAAEPIGKRPEPHPSSLGPNSASPAPESRWSRPGSRVRLDPSLPSPGPLVQYGDLRASGLRFRPTESPESRKTFSFRL